MVETPKRRRSRWWLWLLASVVLVGIGWLGWRYRPLTAAEQQLVGQWESVDDGSTYEFLASRDFIAISPASAGPPMKGLWSATESSLSFRNHVPRSRFAKLPWRKRLWPYFVVTFLPSTAPLERIGPDNFVLYGHEFIRIPDEPPVADR